MRDSLDPGRIRQHADWKKSMIGGSGGVKLTEPDGENRYKGKVQICSEQSRTHNAREKGAIKQTMTYIHDANELREKKSPAVLAGLASVDKGVSVQHLSTPRTSWSSIWFMART